MTIFAKQMPTDAEPGRHGLLMFEAKRSDYESGHLGDDR